MQIADNKINIKSFSKVYVMKLKPFFIIILAKKLDINKNNIYLQNPDIFSYFFNITDIIPNKKDKNIEIIK